MAVEISVVTPWLDHPQFISDYEHSVSARATEVIIVDNGSSQSNAIALHQMVQRLNGKYIRNEENRWFAPANNQGLAAATGKVIVFLNNDIYGGPGWLEQVRAEVAPGALYGPVILSLDVEGTIVFAHEGWCVAGTREAWDLLGGWDAEHHSMPYYEDRDLGFRAQRAGLKLIQTSWPIRHKGKGTSADVPGVGAGHERVRQNLIARVTGRPGRGAHPNEAEPVTLEKATQMLREGFLPEAERAFAVLVNDNAGEAGLWERYAEVLHLSGRHDAAVDALSRAIKLEPTMPRLYINLGIILGRMGRHAEAIAKLRQALERAPQSVDVLVNLSRALFAAGDFDAAAESAYRAVQIQPGNGLAHANMSNALRELGRVGEALAAARSAIGAQPDSPSAWNSLGAALRAMNRLPEALEAYDRSFDLAGYNKIADKNRNEIRALLAEGRKDARK